MVGLEELESVSLPLKQNEYMEKTINFWVIEIRDWGTLHGVGTESEAREWGLGKAEWEGTSMKMREATAEEVKTIRQWDSIAKLIS